MSAPEDHESGAIVRQEQSEVSPLVRVRRRGGHRAGAIAAAAVLLSAAGVGAAYGVTASVSRSTVPAVAIEPARLASVTLPVMAPSHVTPSDLDQRVNGLVSEADRIVAEKLDAEREAAEAAAHAARAAKYMEAAAAVGDPGVHDGGCLGGRDKP